MTNDSNPNAKRLKEETVLDVRPMRDLFALAKFPPRPSLAKAVAAEIFEEAASLAGQQLKFSQGSPLNSLGLPYV